MSQPLRGRIVRLSRNSKGEGVGMSSTPEHRTPSSRKIRHQKKYAIGSFEYVKVNEYILLIIRYKNGGSKELSALGIFSPYNF